MKVRGVAFGIGVIGVVVIGPVAAVAQAGTGRLRGVVFDSTAMSPLAGAHVAVLRTSVSGFANDEGYFELHGVPAGRYTVTFFHDRLQELGTGAVPREVVFADGERQEVALTVPSMETLLAAWCLAEGVGPGMAALAGTVSDSITGVPMPRAQVTVTRVSRPSSNRPTRVLTDNSGYFRLCSVPANEPLRLQAHFGNSPGRSVEVTIPERGAAVQDLSMLMSGEGFLSGTVLDHVIGTPMAGAEISVLGTDARTLSNADGRFTLDGIPPGRHLVTTTHLGFQPRTDSITVFSLETVGVEVRMSTAAVEVEGLVVTTRSRPGQTLNLATAKREDAITQAEIEPLLTRASSVGDLLRLMNVPGLSVRNIRVVENGGGIYDGLCVEVSRRSGGEGCAPAMVAIDMVPQQMPDQILMDLDADVVDRIEILSPIDAAFQFGTLGGNGAILIFTRR